MKQTVLDGVVAIEARAANIVEDAKVRARQSRDKVKADLERLARQLDQEAQAQAASHQAAAQGRKAAAIATLDEQLAAATAALDKVKAERTAPLVEEVVRLLEQRADGN